MGCDSMQHTSIILKKNEGQKNKTNDRSPQKKDRSQVDNFLVATHFLFSQTCFITRILFEVLSPTLTRLWYISNS